MSYRTVYIRASEVRAAARDLNRFGEISDAQTRECLRQMRGKSGRIYAYTAMQSRVIDLPGGGEDHFLSKQIRQIINYSAHLHAEKTNAGCQGCAYCAPEYF